MKVNDTVDKDVDIVPFTITSGQSTSPAIIVYGATMVFFQTPAVLTNATITFQGSIDGGKTFAPVRDINGNLISYTVITNAAGLYNMNAQTFVGLDQIKFVMSGTEAADRTFALKAFAI